MIENNIGLAHLCARRFSGKGVEYDDLFQAGCLGLIKAAERFDESRGLKFSTYAVPVILGEIRRLFRDGGAVRVSRGLRELGRKAKEEQERFQNEHGRAPALQEIADRLGVPAAKAAMALGAARPTISLSSEEDGESIDIPVEAPEVQMTERMTLHTLLLQLEEQDRKLIEYRYYQSMTQQKTAELLGMTQVQVSRREKKLLLYLRSGLLE